MFKRVGKPVFFICFIIIAALVYFAGFGVNSGGSGFAINSASDIRFGIDIRGGVDVTFRPPAGTKVSDSDMSAAVERLRSRCDSLHITDIDLYPNNSQHRIILRFPWKADTKTKDPETAIKELGAMSQLIFKGPDGTTILTGKEVASAQALPDTDTSTGTANGYMVQLKFKPSGKKAFADATTKYNGKVISIYMDEKKIEAPQVQEPITGGTCEIHNTAKPMTSDEATQLAAQINAGALPFKLVTDNYSTISPTLGASALNVMLKAAILAFILICLFMIFFYRLPGIIACIALCGHVAGMLLCISIPQFTLTIPGIAGIILSIGMGVDANVITCERIKEELINGKTLDGAIDEGFERSFAAIFDGNVTVVIVGVMLMIFGSGSVYSFGYTLAIGVVFNILMGVVFSRLMLKSISRLSPFRNAKFFLAAMSKKHFHIDFIGHRKIFYTISISLIAVGIVISAIFGVKLDIQFTGGAIVKYSYTGKLDKAVAQQVAGKALDAQVSADVDKDYGTGTQRLVISGNKSLTNGSQQDLYAALQKQFPDNNIKKYESNDVSPSMGQEFLMHSILAVALASLLIIGYIWIRFRKIGGLPAGVTAFIALVHDVLMAFVAFTIFRIGLNDNFVAVIMTILGYSINDTIVVYDRVREDRRLFGKKMSFKDTVNGAINETFMRSINTTFVVFVSIVVLLAFGLVYKLDSLTTFALPMMVGVVTGCYSTICIASTLWVSWETHKEKKLKLQAAHAAEKQERRERLKLSESKLTLPEDQLYNAEKASLQEKKPENSGNAAKEATVGPTNVKAQPQRPNTGNKPAKSVKKNKSSKSKSGKKRKKKK